MSETRFQARDTGPAGFRNRHHSNCNTRRKGAKPGCLSHAIYVLPIRMPRTGRARVEAHLQLYVPSKAVLMGPTFMDSLPG